MLLEFINGSHTEAGHRIEALRTSLSTNQRNLTETAKTTTASNRKSLQQDDSVLCLSKKFSMMQSEGSDQNKNHN